MVFLLAYEQQEEEEQSSDSSINPPILSGDPSTPLPPASFENTVTDSTTRSGNGQDKTPLDNKQIEQLMKNAEQVTEFCRTLEIRQSVRRNNVTRSVGARESQLVDMPSLEVLQAAQKLRKVIMELLDTEKTYVRDLNCLVSRYLEPLQNEAFLSADEVSSGFCIHL